MSDVYSPFGGVSQLQQLLQERIDFSGSGDNTIVAGVAGQVIRVYRMKASFASSNLNVTDGPGGTVLDGPLAQPFILDYTCEGMPPWYTTSPGNDLVINSSAAVQVGGSLDYTQS